MSNQEALNKYMSELVKYNNDMKRYNQAQDNRSYALMGFPSKPQLENYLPGGVFYKDDEDDNNSGNESKENKGKN